MMDSNHRLLAPNEVLHQTQLMRVNLCGRPLKAFAGRLARQLNDTIHIVPVYTNYFRVVDFLSTLCSTSIDTRIAGVSRMASNYDRHLSIFTSSRV